MSLFPLTKFKNLKIRIPCLYKDKGILRGASVWIVSLEDNMGISLKIWFVVLFQKNRKLWNIEDIWIFTMLSHTPKRACVICLSAKFSSFSCCVLREIIFLFFWPFIKNHFHFNVAQQLERTLLKKGGQASSLATALVYSIYHRIYQLTGKTGRSPQSSKEL